MKALFASLFLISLSLPVLAEAEGNKVAVVSVLRGEAELLIVGKTLKLKKDDWVKEGSVVKTSDRSFVKLVFTDKSQMNIGPNSEMKITKFGGSESGIIDLVKGKIRSQVTKDYLQEKQGKSKLFIKTPNAVMGIRGTDFMISTNGKNTSAILFEGNVVFAKHDHGQRIDSNRLEDVVNRSGVRIHPGEFSVVERERPEPTIPAKLNVHQREMLEKNDNFDSDRNPGNESAKSQMKSVVPEGLSGSLVSNKESSINTEVAAGAPQDVPASSKDAEGFVSGDKMKPANGSFVHIDSGTIIPPGPGSVLDSNTNTFIPGPGQGAVSGGGDYIPPKNVEITTDGKIMVAFKDQSGATRVQEIEKPKPAGVGGMNLADAGKVIAANPGMINPNGPIGNDILNKQFNPNGLNDLSNLQRNLNGGINNINDANMNNSKTKTTIIGQ